MSALSAVVACGGAGSGETDTDPGAAAALPELAFDASVPVLPDFDVDTGWQPQAGPAGIRLVLDAAGSIDVGGRGRAEAERVAGTPSSGTMRVSATIGMELSARLDTLGLEWEGVVERFAYDIPESQEVFDPFELDDPVVLETPLPAAELGTVPIPSVPGASVRLDVTGGTLSTTYETTCAASDGAHAQVLGVLTVGGDLDLAATILVDVPLVGTETLGPFEVNVPLPSAPRPLDLGTRDIATAEATDDQGVCAAVGTSGSTSQGGATDSAGGDTDSDTSGDSQPVDPTTETETETETGTGGSGGEGTSTGSSAPEGPVLYLNFDGATLSSGYDDAPSNTTQMAMLATTLAPFPDAVLRDEITALMQQHWEPFDVTVTDERPETGPYEMVVFTPSMPLGNVRVYGSTDCGNSNNNSVGAVFYAHGISGYELAVRGSWALGTGLGLENANDMDGDIMGGGGSFRDTCVPVAGEPQCEHAARCKGGQQNSVHELHAAFANW